MSTLSKLGEVKSRLGNELVAAGTFRHQHNFPIGADPSTYYRFIDDFDGYDAAGGGGDSVWKSGGTGITAAAPNSAYADGPGGTLAVILSAAANADWWIHRSSQSAVTAAGAFLMTAENNKPVWFEARFKCSVVGSGAAIAFGLAKGDTGEPLADSTLAFADDDAVLLMADTADATLDLKTFKNGTGASEALGTLTADTWHTVGFYFDGKNSLEGWLDGKMKKRITVGSTLPDDVLLTPFAATKTASAGHTLTIDYIDAAIKR